MIQTAVLITGVSGGIGQALKKAFEQAGDQVIGLDCKAPAQPIGQFVQADLNTFCIDAKARNETLSRIKATLDGLHLRAIINNAAVQIIKPFADLNDQDWVQTLNVNLLSGALLTQAFLKELEQTHGSVINIASIHARLTKSGFTAYAASKAALVGLTRSLAVELGSRIRVNAICPAAIDTPMLRQGFQANPRGLKQLAKYHPTGRIGTADEVAALAVFLASEQAGFINGASYEMDGAIGNRLHDPSAGL